MLCPFLFSPGIFLCVEKSNQAPTSAVHVAITCTTGGEMEIGGFMGLASLSRLVSYKLNKRPCLRKVKWKGSEGKTRDVRFCHTHTSCTHIQPCAHRSQLWSMGSSGNSPQGMVSGTPFIFTLLTKQSVALALTLDLWKQWGRRQGQRAYYLCVCFPFLLLV